MSILSIWELRNTVLTRLKAPRTDGRAEIVNNALCNSIRSSRKHKRAGLRSRNEDVVFCGRCNTEGSALDDGRAFCSRGRRRSSSSGA